MQRVLSFIIAKDENNQKIYLNIEVDENINILNINIAGCVLSKEEAESVSKKIKIEKSLFEEMKDNEPLDITQQFVGMTKEEIIKSLKER